MDICPVLRYGADARLGGRERVQRRAGRSRASSYAKVSISGNDDTRRKGRRQTSSTVGGFAVWRGPVSTNRTEPIGIGYLT